MSNFRLASLTINPVLKLYLSSQKATPEQYQEYWTKLKLTVDNTTFVNFEVRRKSVEVPAGGYKDNILQFPKVGVYANVPLLQATGTSSSPLSTVSSEEFISIAKQLVQDAKAPVKKKRIRKSPSKVTKKETK